MYVVSVDPSALFPSVDPLPWPFRLFSLPSPPFAGFVRVSLLRGGDSRDFLSFVSSLRSFFSCFPRSSNRRGSVVVHTRQKTRAKEMSAKKWVNEALIVVDFK